MIIIVIDGPDGVGKTTVAHKVVKKLQSKKVKCVYQHFPDYDYPSGELIKRCLNGENGDFINLDWKISLAMYDIDRRLWLERNREKLKDYVVITDRWSTSSFQYQTAQMIMQLESYTVKELMDTYGYIDMKILSNCGIDIERFFQWLDNEHSKYGLQRSHINFYLSLDQYIINERIRNRVREQDAKVDQFESDVTFTYLVNAIGEFLAAELYSNEVIGGYDAKYDNTKFIRIDASSSSEEIADKIVDYLSNNLTITLNMIDI